MFRICSGKVALRLGLMLPPLVTQLLLCEGKAESSKLRLPEFSSTGKAISMHKLAASLDQK